jgi:hypothetical protein
LFFATRLAGGEGRVAMRNVGYGPCPVCGGTGRVLDGVYELAGDTVRFFAEGDYSREQLQRLLDSLTRAQREAATPEQVIGTVEAEAPEFKAVAERFLVPRDASAFYTLLAVLIAVLALILSERGGTVMSEDVERLERRVVEQLQQQPVRPPRQARPDSGANLKKPPRPPRKARAQRAKQQSKKRRR